MTFLKNGCHSLHFVSFCRVCVLPFSAATVLEDFEDDLYVQLMEESNQYIDSNWIQTARAMTGENSHSK